MTPHLPENIRKCMTPEDRKRLGVLTNPEKGVEVAAKNEKKLQGEVANYLNLHGLWFDQDAMHRRRFGSLGAPDFQFPYKGQGGVNFYVAWECKTDSGKLSAVQYSVRVQVEAQGGQWRLIRSLQECQDHLRSMDAQKV